MNDLISRRKAILALSQSQLYVAGLRNGKTIISDYNRRCRETFIKAVEDVEPADAEYVRHASWIVIGKTDKGARILMCSRCANERKGGRMSTYCGDCGAKMDLKVIRKKEVK